MTMIIDGTNGLSFNNATTQASAGLVAGGTIATGTITTATVTTLNSSTGVLATQNGMAGIAKAWVVFTGQGSATILSSFNVSSVTRTGTGAFTIAFTTAMPTANYSTTITNGFNGSGNDWAAYYAGVATTANVKCQFATATVTAAIDPSYVNLTVNSN